MSTFITGEILSEGGITGNTISATTITGNTFYGSGAGLTNVQVSYSGGTVTGLTINGDLIVTGNTNISGATNIVGDVTGFRLVSSQSLGDEGGEVRLSTSQTNNSLSGGSITIDINQNKLRFFETGSPNRGAYIDISSATAGVGTNLLAAGGTPGGSTGEVQFNNGGTFSGAPNVEISNGNLQLVSTTDPSPPSAGNLILYSKDIAGRQIPKWIGPSGIDTPIQPNIMFNQVSVIGPGGATTVGVLGCTVTNVGTISNPNITTTNLKTQTRRFTNTSAATAGSLSSTRIASFECWRGNVAGQGGFFINARFGITTLVAGNRMFVGLTDTATTAPTNIDPTTSATPGKIGMAINSNTGNWNLVHNITGTAPTVIPLGVSFPVNNTDLLELILFAKPNDTVVTYRITNLSTNAQTSGTLSTNLPSSTTPLGRVIWMTNAGTASAVAFDCSRFSLETDY